MNDYYTENIADFGYRERDMLIELLQAWQDHGLPENFSYDNVRPAFNMNSGNVFLVNDAWQVAMYSDGKIEEWHTLPYGGEEGFISDLLELDRESLHPDDLEYIDHFTKTEATK